MKRPKYGWRDLAFRGTAGAAVLMSVWNLPYDTQQALTWVTVAVALLAQSNVDRLRAELRRERQCKP